MPYILPVVKHIFNTFTASVFPSSWKIASIIPIPKKPMSNSPPDFRPVSILCFLSKVFEKLVYCQMTEYLNSNNLISEWQSGFRRFHSCESALLKVTSDIRVNLDKNNAVALCLLDFSKAFDSVSHNLLLTKLSSTFKFSSNAISLISNFLRNRAQYVRGKVSTSQLLPVRCGVPQGSVLGPLLFSLFINDLPHVITASQVHIYADDVQIYKEGNPADFDPCINLIDRDLSSIWSWASENKLVLNPSKSQCMIVARKNVLCNNNLQIELNGTVLPVMRKVKNLGLTLNNNMSCCDYINDILSKIYRGLRSLRLTASLLSLDMRLKLIRSLIIPYFLYGSIIFPALDSGCSRKLEVAFNDCTRFIFGLPRFAHISDLQNTVLNCPLHLYLRQRALVFLHKIITTGNPPYLLSYIKELKSQRHAKLKIPCFSHVVGERSYFVQAVRW